MTKPTLLFAMDPGLTERVLSADALARLGAACEVLDVTRHTTWETAAALLPRAEVLVTGWGCPPISAEVLDRAPHLRLIAHTAGSVKRLLTDPGFFDRGIAVTTAADANAVPVAEFTLAAILMANKQVFRLRELYRQGRSRRLTDPLAAGPIGNLGARVGLIGASRIGRLVIERLKGFDLELLIHDPYLAPDDPILAEARQVGLDEAMQAEVVSLHAPLLDTTRGMISARELALMREGATLINTARGAIVDQEALIAELSSGRLNAVLDVTFPEVPEPTSPLYDLPNVFLTPHAPGALGTEQARLGDLAAAEVARFCAGQPLRHALTADAYARTA
ncbi:hydroxyacid dehydrogenase [Marinovum sp.]|uniref:hydroxyacid dehydrogenase n=1 Tax=Marinovum sp. TaxID=2024839 RepID=UPI002B277A8B|nr:hydroxyacid dehydrogenase [Marinovum sp.]